MRLIVDHDSRLLHDQDNLQEACNEAGQHEIDGLVERASSVQEARLDWLRANGYTDHAACLGVVYANSEEGENVHS